MPKTRPPSPELAAGIRRVNGVKQLGRRCGNWLSLEQCSALLAAVSNEGLQTKRNHAILAVLLGCGLRRSELVALTMESVQMRQGHWAIVDLVGKGGHVRTVPMPLWVKEGLDRWTTAAGITKSRIFRAVNRRGTVWRSSLTQNAVWHVVTNTAKRAGLDPLAPHDLRRTCAKLCHSTGGELEQIQFLLGHASSRTTERYLGCEQNLGQPVNDRFVPAFDSDCSP